MHSIYQGGERHEDMNASARLQLEQLLIDLLQLPGVKGECVGKCPAEWRM